MDGGIWSEGDTWIGGSPPAPIDNVIINGLVALDINTTCENLTVTPNGILQNIGDGTQELTIFSDVANAGIIKGISYIFTLNIQGNITNSGTWINYQTNLTGNTTQTLTTITPFGGDNLSSLKPSGNISTNDVLRFENCMVDFNGDTLFMTNGYDSIFMNSGHLQETTILGTNSIREIYFNQNSLAWVEDVIIECDELVVGGSFQFAEFFEVYANVRVEGIFQNKAINHQSAYIYGNVINNGIIKDLIYAWHLYITGDIIHNGTWSNYFTYLSGIDQILQFANVFEGENFINSNIEGKVISNTNLMFDNTKIEFNYDTLMFSPSSDSLIVNGQYLRNAIITKQANKSIAFLNCTQSNNAYFHDVTIVSDQIDLGGTFQFSPPMNFYGDVIVSGIFQNNPSGNHTAYIYGNVTNNGTIQDPFLSFILHISGDINQNGDWINNQTILDGTNDQSINLVNNQQISGTVYFDALNAGAPYQWYYEGGILNSPDFSGETSNLLTWQVPVGSDWFGEFYCQSGAGSSRIITVEGGIIADIALFLEGPYNGTGMNTDLTNNPEPVEGFPLSQPYNISPWNYSGLESVTSIPPDIVDWMLVEFRESAGGPETATPETMIAKKSLFLRNDGYLVNLDGSRDININVPLINDNLYVVLWHRNHLPILSNFPLLSGNGKYTFDFSTAASQAFGDSQSDLGGGVFGMIGGDENADGTINEFDGTEVWNQQAGNTGYLQGDANMNTHVDNEDKNGIWLPNIGKSEILPD